MLQLISCNICIVLLAYFNSLTCSKQMVGVCVREREKESERKKETERGEKDNNVNYTIRR